MDFEKGKTREEKIDKFLDSVAWWHHQKEDRPGVWKAVGDIRDSLQKLNSNINEANESSTRLTAALNKITLWGAIIAGAGVLVALASLIFEIYKYFWGIR